MATMNVQFDALSAIEMLKKDVKTNAEKKILDMVSQVVKLACWNDASEWESMKYRLDGRNIMIVMRDGRICTESSNWLEVDANGRLFRRYEKDRVMYFMPVPETPEVTEAESEDEDKFVEFEKNEE